MALSMKLAQGELLQKEAHRMPVYLLDDIFGELDPERRNAFGSVTQEGANADYHHAYRLDGAGVFYY